MKDLTQVGLLNRLNIGRRLTVCFVVIIALVLVGDALLLWQFHTARMQSERLAGISQELIAVVRLQTALLSFDANLEKLARSGDVDRLVREAGPLRARLLEDTAQARGALQRLPPGALPEPTFLPTLEAIESTLPSQLDAITALAAAGDWQAVKLRLANEKEPLESQTSLLVKRVEQHVSQQQAEAAQLAERVERRIILIVPLTALAILAIASLLGMAITRSITNPLGRLVEGSEALARSEFQHQVPVLGQDELAQLGQVFNLTAARLQALYETLQKREAYLAEAQRLSHSGSWAWDVRTRKIFWSEETFHIFGLDPGITPTTEIFEGSIHPDDLAGLRPVEAALLAGRDADYSFRIILPDNSIRHVRSVAHPVTDDSGQVIEFVGTTIDVTERKQAEEERERLRQAQADLAYISRVTTMGALTASLAHEIKQPITAALTDAKTCLRWLKRIEPDLAEASEAAARMVKDVSRAGDIISRVSALFRKGIAHREVVDVNELITQMVSLLRSEAHRHAILIRAELDSGLPGVMADPVQLQQVLMNLMLNGIDAMKDLQEPGTLTIKSEETDTGELVVSVRDTGVGIPLQQRDQIFDAFFTTKPHGTGMGLAISRSIVESHGGRLWATANVGPGASFHFSLRPAETTAAEESSGHSQEVHP